MKDNKIEPNYQIKCRDKLIDLRKTKIMGIINATPDSFFSGSRANYLDAIVEKTALLLNNGADIIDIGGVSTRPGADEVSEEEELERLIPAIQIIVKEFPNVILSVDTFRSNVVKLAVNEGASIINDISCGEYDVKMFETIAKLDVPYVLMHSRGTAKTMQNLTNYKNVVTDVIYELSVKITKLRALGVKDIIVDPGFGFAKTIEQNFKLLKNLSYFKVLDCPVLVGLSRKSMIYKSLNVSPEEALNGTTVLNTIATVNGAAILRVHDAKEAKEVVELVNKFY